MNARSNAVINVSYHRFSVTSPKQYFLIFAPIIKKKSRRMAAESRFYLINQFTRGDKQIDYGI